MKHNLNCQRKMLHISIQKAQGGAIIIEILNHFNFAHPHQHFCFESRLNLGWLGTWRRTKGQRVCYRGLSRFNQQSLYQHASVKENSRARQQNQRPFKAQYPMDISVCANVWGEVVAGVRGENPGTQALKVCDGVFRGTRQKQREWAATTGTDCFLVWIQAPPRCSSHR